MKKKIFLIGLNLYSIFLSSKIKSDFKDIDITILEGSKNFLNAYNPLKIGKYYVNPGFHALEDVRAKSLINFLSKIIKFNKLKKTRGILVGDNLISYQDSYKNWPEDIKKKYKFRKKNFYFINKKSFTYLDKQYIKYLKNCFSDKRTSFDDAIILSYPWFFPPNYKSNSKDEASIFNQKIRDKKIIHKYAFPDGGLFRNISEKLKKFLKLKGIKVKLNKPIKFVEKNKIIFFKGYKELNNSEYLKIICIPVKPLSISLINNKTKKTNSLSPIKYFTGLIEVKNFFKSDLDKFTEIITASELAFGLKRISLYSDILKIDDKKIYQIEFLEHLNKPDIEKQLKNILYLISKFIYFKDKNKLEKNMKIIGYSFVRNVFRPKKSDINLITKTTTKFFDKKKEILFPRQITWPINSNKHFIYANEDYKKIIKKKLNLNK